MALTPDQNRFRRDMHRALVDRPLEPEDDYRIPIHEQLDAVDPIRMMVDEIDFSDRQSIQFLSGFRGSGKTTELFRCRRMLEEKQALVLYADAMDYLNPAEPLELTEVLMVVAGAFSDAVADHPELGEDLARESYWDRLWNFFTKTRVNIKEVNAGVEYASPTGGPLGVLKGKFDLKAEIRTATTFKKQLQAALSGHQVALKNDVDDFIDEGIAAIREIIGDNRNIVFIFDSLEKITGTRSNWGDLIQSAELLFTAYVDQLELPNLHVIYSVPPWLKFLVPSTVPMQMLPTIHLWKNDAERSSDMKSWAVLRTLIEKRLRAGGQNRLFGFGADGQKSIDRLIAASGGHIRDLLRLFQEAIKRTTVLPVDDVAITGTINAAIRNFPPLSLDDAKWLRQIERTRDISFSEVNHLTVERASRFLDTHRVIYFVNGDSWYDVHPLLRDQIDRVLGAADADRSG
jgi:hypothetical protein